VTRARAVGTPKGTAGDLVEVAEKPNPVSADDGGTTGDN